MYGEQMVNGKQLTLTWHVDNMKVSHINKNVVSAFILYLKSVYGEMHESIGKHRDYLGMWLDFSRKGDVQISMEEYLRGVLENVQEIITMTVVIHVGEHLFTIRDTVVIIRNKYFWIISEIGISIMGWCNYCLVL